MSFGYSMIAGRGRVAANEDDQIWYPRTPREGTCGVVLCHGSGNPQGYIDATNQKSSLKLAAALASAGIPCISGDFGGQSWGNADVHIDNARSVLEAAFPLMRTDKICLVGGSMGGAVAAHYSQTHPAEVAAMVGLIPLLDLVAFYEANPGAVANEVGTAWGVTAPSALPAGADIAANATLASDIPLLVGYSTADATVLPEWVLAYVAAVGGTAVISDTTAGHSDAAVGGLPISTIGQFLVAHGA